MAVNVLEGVELNDIKLGQSVEETMANIDENFDKIIEVIDDLDDLVPTNVNDLEGSNILVTTQSGKATDSAKLEGKAPSHYLNYSNLTNRPSTLPNPQALKISDGTNTISYTGAEEKTITKASIGLSKVTNVQAIPIDQKGVANGVAELNSAGRVNDSEKLGGNSSTYYLNYNNLSNKPTSLPNPKKLIFAKGDGSQDVTYNGNSDVTITKATLGLENATNAPTIPTTEKGAAGGVATLDNTGKVPTEQLPSFVDDVLEYSNRGAFPTTGETGKIYVDITNGKTYRWGGTTYVEISKSLALGTTSSTAFAGDRGKALEDKSINGHRLGDEGNIYLSLNDISDGGGFVRVKSGGDVTISNGVITVNKVGGQTADQIGKVKDVQVNGVSKVDSAGVANITIDALRSGYANVTASASRTINNTLYYGFTVEKTDIEFEVYNSANQQILTQKVIDGDNLFVACSTTSGGTYALRTILGSGVGGGGGGFVTTDMLNAVAERLQPYTTQTTETFTLNPGEYEIIYTAPNGQSIYKINITRTVYAPAYSKFSTATIIDPGVTGDNDTGEISINSDRKSATITIIGSTRQAASPEVTVTYEHTTIISF